jgi:hypothetical protein
MHTLEDHINEAAVQITDIAANVTAEREAGAIDWTKLRAAFAKLLAVLGPIILPILLDMFTKSIDPLLKEKTE